MFRKLRGIFGGDNAGAADLLTTRPAPRPRICLAGTPVDTLGGNETRLQRSRHMYGRRRFGMPIALLAFAQLLLPSFGVVHAHGSKNVALDAGAAERHTVHAHGAGLAHDHSSGSTDDNPAGTDFQRLGAPAATLRASTADWISASEEALAPPETSMSGRSRGAALVGTPVFRRNPRGSKHSLGPPREPLAAAQPWRWLTRARPLRGPPFSA